MLTFFFFILTPSTPVSWVLSHSDRILASCIPHARMKPLQIGGLFINVNFDIAVDMVQGESKPFTRFQLGKFFSNIRKYIYLKKLSDFRKFVETGVDPRLR